MRPIIGRQRGSRLIFDMFYSLWFMWSCYNHHLSSFPCTKEIDNIHVGIHVYYSKHEHYKLINKQGVNIITTTGVNPQLCKQLQ